MNCRILKNVSVLAAGALAMAVGACGSGSGNVAVAPKAEWSYYVPDGSPITVTPNGDGYRVDYGTGAIGTKATMEIRVRNIGSAPMTVRPLVFPDGGFETDIPSGGLVVNITDAYKTIKVSFAPTEKIVYEWNDAVAVAGYQSENLPLHLVGTGQPPAFTCDWANSPAALDFGKVVKNQKSARTITCTNNSDVDGVLIVSSIGGDQRAMFTHPFSGNNGRVSVEAGQSLDIEVKFSANAVISASANLPIRYETLDGEADVVNVSLRGTVLTRAVSCGAPTSSVDFGFVAPGSKKTVDVVCSNEASQPYQITGIALDAESDDRFTWEPTSTPIDLPASANDTPGQATIEVTFYPGTDDMGTRKNGKLVLNTSDTSTPTIDMRLTGFAGGPVISCLPDVVTFGHVPKTNPKTMSVTCRNDGTDDALRTDDALLVQEIVVVSDSPVEEFSAVVRGGLSETGYAVGDYFTVDITYSPKDNSEKDDAKITFISNDTANPTDAPYFVLASGVGRDLLSCQFEVIPDTIKFGIVDKGDSMIKGFAIRNKRADSECLVQNLRLASGPGCSAFSLPGPVVETDILPASGELRYEVMFAPTAYQSAPFTCEVRFDISSEETPSVAIPVRGVSQQPCILISPNDLDFGTVKPNCSSRKRDLVILNTCQTDQKIARVETDGGIEGEFEIVAVPPPNHVLTSGQGVEFTMAFQPINEGPELGSAYVYVEGLDEPYMATLRGRGDNNATQTDTFAQSERQKVDILWVLDNSGSMGDEQALLATNLTPFLSYAKAQEIDYHIAITSTGLTPAGASCPGGANGGERGRFFPVNGERPRIITRDTLDMKEVWDKNFRVGTCHSSEVPLQAAHLALTPPLVDQCQTADRENKLWLDGNCGFLRPEAHLSIIAVTDEPDQSPQTVMWYYSQFQSIKGFRNPHLFNFHAITGDPDTGCGSAKPGNRLKSLVDMTDGGVFQSICASDWKKSLEAMSAGAFGFKTCFPLGNEPEDKNGKNGVSDTDCDETGCEITVKMNGRDTASKGAQKQTIWYYSDTGDSDDPNPSICFSTLAVPEPGTQIEVSYKVACRDP